MTTTTTGKNLKSTKIIYWLTTGLLAFFILPGAFFMNSPEAVEGITHLGLPEWFRWELGIGQVIGGIIILLPTFGKHLKEWAYVALGIVYISALIAHLSVDGLVISSFAPLITFTLLIISYTCYHKIKG